jgi:two-component system, OmpR family, sensor histidine kinase KdpD
MIEDLWLRLWRQFPREEVARKTIEDVLVAIGVVTVVSLVIGGVVTITPVSNVSDLYIIGTALLAARRGIVAALVASGLAFLVYDWFFIPPVHTFTVSDPSEYLALVTLLVTSAVIGQLLARVQQRATEAQRRQIQTELLYDISQAALSSSEVKSVYALALRRVTETLGLGWSRLFIRRDSRVDEVASYGTPPNGPDDLPLLRRVVEEARPMGVWLQSGKNVRILSELDLTTGQASSREGDRLSEVYVPLAIESRVEGVLVVGGRPDPGSLTAEEARFVQAFSNQLATAVQRDRLADERARARALEESDRLKSALVSSVSHELKTPLTAIKASATTLLRDEAAESPAVRHELAESINRETDRLTRLVSNLLDMSRLEAGGLQPRCEWVSIADVVADVLDRLDPMLQGHEVTVQIPEDLPETPLDFVLISQVLTNLLDNAVRYAPEHAGIVISAEVVRGQLRVTVFNQGSHIPPADLERLFDKFVRLSTAPGGTGLGLAIAKGIIESHHGRIWAENVGRRGVAFTFTIPSPRRGELATHRIDPDGMIP